MHKRELLLLHSGAVIHLHSRAAASAEFNELLERRSPPHNRCAFPVINFMYSRSPKESLTQPRCCGCGAQVIPLTNILPRFCGKIPWVNWAYSYIYTYKQNNCIYRLLCLHFQHSVNWKLYTCQINDSKQKFRNKSLCISLCETNGCILHKYRSRKCRRQRPFLRTQYRTWKHTYR